MIIGPFHAHNQRKILKRLLRMETWGLNGIDRKIASELNYRDGYFVELGANDGVTQSNTMILERYKGWKGLLIEPHTQKFNELIKNRSKRNSFANCACVNFGFGQDDYRYLYSNLMSIGLDDENEISDRRVHAEAGRKYLSENETNEIHIAKARTLDSILRESQAPKLIDFLSLDVEGAELSVLQGINHEDYKFKFILVESRNISRIETYLTGETYSLIKKLSDHDYLFKYDFSLSSEPPGEDQRLSNDV